jgi:antitoxin component HigA of HigAB toxin-antitoxin module
MELRILKTDDEYDAAVEELYQIEFFGDFETQRDYAALLTLIIKDYENTHFPIEQ